MRPLFVFATCLVTVSLASAQKSLFQSADGQTAVYLQHSSVIVNLGDSKASAAYFHRTNNPSFSWGLEGYATANSGVTSLFSSGKPTAPEGGGDFTFGRHFVFVPMPQAGMPSGREDWWLLDVGYGRSSFELFRQGSAPDANTSKSNFDRFRAIAAYNYFGRGNLIAGIAAGAERRNNLRDLNSTSLQTIVVPAPSGSQTSIVKTQAGYYGQYKEYIAAPIYTDILFYPGISVPGFGNPLGLDFFSRSDVAASNRSSSGGLGIFIFDKNDPLTPYGGISVGFNGTKVQLALTAGFTFAKAK